MIVDRGSNAGWGVEGITSLLVAGPYRWEAHDIRGYGVQTNRFTFGAYRAPGAPTAAFALESLLDELAQKLELDPIELRLQNAVVEGDVGDQRQPVSDDRRAWRCSSGSASTRSGQRATRSRTDEGIGMAAGALAGRERARRGRLPGGHGRDDDGRHLRRRHERREHRVRRHRRGGVRPVAGQGARRRPPTRPPARTRARAAARRSRTRSARPCSALPSRRARRCSHAASQELEIAPDDLEVVDGVVRAVGRARPLDHGRGAREEGAPLRRALRADRGPRRLGADDGRAVGRRAPLPRPRRPRDRRGTAPRATSSRRTSAARSTPRSSRDRCAAERRRAWAGRSSSSSTTTRTDACSTGSFLDYAIPTAERVPEIETLIVEVPAPDGPFGAKGIGEAPVVGAPAAIANAVAAAAGTRLYELPMTAPRVWAALRS